MKKNFKLFKIGIFLALILGFALGQDAYGAAISSNGTGGGNWSASASWAGGVVPGAGDDVTIVTGDAIVLTADASCLSLTMAGTATLDATTAGVETITVLGDIIEAAATQIGGVAEPNLIIGDVTLATSTTSDITVNDATNASTFANITLYNAAVDLVGAAPHDVLNIAGNLTLAGASALTTDGTNMVDVTFTASSTLTVSDDSFASFNVIDIAAGTLTTADDFTVVQIDASVGTLNQTAGTCYLNAGAVSAITGGAAVTPTFYNLYINATGVSTATTLAGIIVKGDLTKVGSSFTFIDVPVTFNNTTAKEIVISGTMIFFDIQVAINSSVTTNSSFTLGDAATTGSTLTVASGGSFVANTGTITLDADGAGAAAVNITLDNKDSDPNSLTLSKVIIDDNDGGGIVRAANDFVVTGDFEVTAQGTFQNYNSATTTGKVVFSNTVQRTITNAGTLEFGKIEIAPASSVTTAGSFIITNGNNADSSGIDVKATGTFAATAGTITFGGTTEDAQKMLIENSGTLTFNNLTVANVANANVETESDFTIAGNISVTGDNANEYFDATGGGTITFSGTPTVVGTTASKLKFNNLIIQDDWTLTDAEFVEIVGDVTIDGDALFGAGANATASFTFNGTSLQTISLTGVTNNNTYPCEFGTTVINNAAGVSLECSLTTTNLTLTAGELDINDNTISPIGTVARTTGYINGGTGTYLITTGHATTIFSDDLFRATSGDNGSLYNLTVNAAESLDGNLRVNGDLLLDGADLTIGDATNGYELHCFGNITQTATGDQLLFHTAKAADAKLILDSDGSTKTCPLANDLFGGTDAPSIEVRRAATLSDALTMDGTTAASPAKLTLNSGTQNLNLNGQVLTFEANSLINIVSGQMLASATGSGIVLGTTHTEVPANIFVNDEVRNFTSNAEITLLGNLTILGTFTHNTDDNVYTKDNILTFGPSCTVTTNAFDDAKHIIGNLRKTVSGSTATLFEVGGGDANAFRPVSIKFATPATSQVVQVSSLLTNPTTGRAGNPAQVVQSEWTITPIGSPSNTFDSVQVNFGWGADQANGITAANDQTFAARWDGSAWEDFRKSSKDDAALADVDVAAAPGSANDGLFMAEWIEYPLSSTDFGGTWAVFHATTASDDLTKNAATALAAYKLVFVTQPTTVENGFPFIATVQLQDQYGNPQTVTSATTISIVETSPDAVLTGTTVTAVIPAGSSSVAVSGLILTAANIADVELKASASYNSTTVYGISDPIDVLQTQPITQGSMLTLSNEAYTSMTVTFTGTGTGGDKAIIVAKAGSAIDSDDFPVDGTSYIGNNVFGAGSILGDGVVVYNGAASSGAADGYSFTLSGLAPGTDYYLRVFTYQGSNGTENYNLNPGALSSRSATTTSATDDDVAYGSNNTIETAKPIGANSAVKGTIADATDEDWFSFMVTSAASNIRVKLTGVPANYNLELYNADNRRVRRATLTGQASEYVVINNLDAGTYSIRIYGVDGANDSDPYTVEVQTRDTEIFSVTQ